MASKSTAPKGQSSVDKVYEQVRLLATDFEFKPNEKINERSLAERLGTSRTPLREALNRLVAEGFLSFENGRGFFCRSLSPQKILDLYEARLAIECEALRLAVTRASDEEIAAIKQSLKDTEAAYSSASSPRELVELDEAFHLSFVRLAKNLEFERLLANINARIRYVRWIDMSERRGITPADHMRIADALARRDEEGAVRELRNHIAKRSEEATEAVRTAYSQLYVS
ncbi:GntR family transcriptional regulator [Pelagibius sp.]|uniref:GntR family transcriptional regulator n=1 Tax=Pelagibius sp. TaxID=1931238 RepID=UPI00261267C4|nr:GntR family transcriptional regulator [Pelagibius sp.]